MNKQVMLFVRYLIMNVTVSGQTVTFLCSDRMFGIRFGFLKLSDKLRLRSVYSIDMDFNLCRTLFILHLSSVIHQKVTFVVRQD